MPGVLEDPAARQDILIRRTVLTEVGIRWERSVDGGRSFEPVDLSDGWSARVRLLSPAGEEWLVLPARITPDHMVLMSFAPADFSDPVWASRSSGVWLCDLQPAEGAPIRHGEGYFYLQD